MVTEMLPGAVVPMGTMVARMMAIDVAPMASVVTRMMPMVAVPMGMMVAVAMPGAVVPVGAMVARSHGDRFPGAMPPGAMPATMVAIAVPAWVVNFMPPRFVQNPVEDSRRNPIGNDLAGMKAMFALAGVVKPFTGQRRLDAERKHRECGWSCRS